MSASEKRLELIERAEHQLASATVMLGRARERVERKRGNVSADLNAALFRMLDAAALVVEAYDGANNG